MEANKWIKGKLGDICTLKGGSGFKERFQGKKSGEYPFIKVSDMNSPENKKYIFTSNNWVSKEDIQNLKANLMPKNSVVFAKVGAALNLNKRRILTRPTSIDNNMMAAIHKDNCDAEFLYQLLLNIDMGKISQEGAVPSVNQSELSNLKISYPCLEEQQKIASCLSTWDAAIEAVEEQIALATKKKKALMQKLLTGEVRLPGFEGEWKRKLLSELCDDNLIEMGRGQVISKKDIQNDKGSYPIYSSSVKNNGLMGYYGKHMFDEELISWSIDGGGHFFYREKHKFSITNVSGYMRIISSSLDCKFLAYQLSMLHEKLTFDYQSKAHPSVIKSAYTVAIPSVDEQVAISNLIYTVDNEINLNNIRLDFIKQQKKSLMQQLLG